MKDVQRKFSFESYSIQDNVLFVVPALAGSVTTPNLPAKAGTTNFFFLNAIVEYRALKKQIQVRDFGSIEKLTDYLRTFTPQADFIEKVNALGIIRDAEKNPANRAFASVCDWV